MNKNLHKTIINRNTGLIVVVAENKMAVFSFSGSLKNNFDKDKVQNEIDLQVKVTKEFRSNVQHFQVEQNKRKDELKAKLERNEISQADYDAQVSRIQKQSLLVNMLAGGLTAPSDSVLGIATSTVSPAVSYEIGQYFKKEGKEGSFEHIATHAVLGALTSAANGGNALNGAVSAGGAEALAPIVAKVLYGKDNSQNLTADEKETVVSVTTAISTITGGAIGDSSANAYIGNTVAGNAVENNWQLNQSVRPTEKDIALHTRKYSPLETIIPATMSGYATDEETKTQLMFLSGVRNAETGAVAVALSPYAYPQLANPVSRWYLKESALSVGTGWFITTQIEKEPYRVFNAMYDATGGVISGGVLGQGGKYITRGVTQPMVHLPGGVVSKTPNTMEAKIVEQGVKVSVKAKEEFIAHGIDTAASEQVAKSLNIDQDKSRVIAPARK